MDKLVFSPRSLTSYDYISVKCEMWFVECLAHPVSAVYLYSDFNAHEFRWARSEDKIDVMYIITM
jgi:hypothetical protein